MSLTTGKNLNGVIDHVTAEAVYLQSRKQTIEVRREDIGRLYRKKDKSRIKPVLIGAAAGAAVAGIAAPQPWNMKLATAGRLPAPLCWAPQSGPAWDAWQAGRASR
jgi:hypothetical protein